MKKGSVAPPPNYQPLADASLAASTHANDLAQQQFDWARQTYADQKGTTDQVVNSFLQTQDDNQAAAAKDRARYETAFQPLEDSLIADAKSYASPERKDLEVGRAAASVAQDYESQRAAYQRDLTSFGVDVGSVRFAALDSTVRSQQAAATAAASNQASLQVDATGRAMRDGAIQVGRGLPGQIAGTYGTSLQAGSGAVNSGNATTATGAQTMGTGAQWAGLGSNDLGQASNIQNAGYNNQINAARVNQTASSGWGTAAGIALGGLRALPGPGTTMPVFAATGGEIPDRGAVPVSASPSGGKAIDDVHAMLTPGEFVIPQDAASWIGEQKLQKLIEKSRMEKQGAVAKPAIGPAPAPRAGALPQPAVG